ncbi:non-hydrolyzing UDP-N-acetylglucosamine 2-epimerase [Umezawaea sp. Da 62-37]|uniref:non-hydrolyzing UDP-N-acetylglucosamine 2-epimerase n=1 Tax=Umezawaea sp. Da 62-37 TaxID=3075927 RepID=UPI0028F6D992|nr:UDP-N-acetylglucosamine 2-epimerase (non-hydrolyzing) [Umezawaea sp. Da 62-37]WNV84626.1 UDP-N-acetylglucosamine 2-epimerase (non-hydrolyzing) [Umezawaea sp. Da 62-37]
MRKVAVILGTRPEAIKCAPVIRALHEDPRFTPVVLSTGQHRQMLDETLDAFGIRPDLDLDVMTDKQTLSQVTHRALSGLADRLTRCAVEAVMVHGDTATTLAGGLAGFHHRVPVVHIEAGLRSGNLHSPFPEEANRRLVAQIADLHLAPTPGNSANLIREGIGEGRIVVTGNTVVDALRWASTRSTGYGHPDLADLDDDPRRVVLASAHRRESWDMLPQIGKALRALAADPGIRVVVPLHRNPVVREGLLPEIAGVDNITVVDPLGYLEFCGLMRRSDLILSDSSGAEEEGPALGKPTLVLRDITERPEAITAGAARLVGRTTDRIVDEVTSLLGDQWRYDQMAGADNPYGDGHASERVVGALAHFFGDGPAVMPFVPGCRIQRSDALAGSAVYAA